MSWQAVKAVLATEIRPAGRKLVAVVLAEHADEHGGSIRPSVLTVARLASMGRRQVVRHMRELIDSGHLVAVDAKPGHATIYRINATPTPVTGDTPVAHDTPVTGDTPVAHDTPVAGDSNPCHPRQGRGVAGDTQSTIEPSEPPEEQKTHFDPIGMDIPDSIDDETWALWVEAKRRRTGREVSEHEARAFLAKAIATTDPNDVIVSETAALEKRSGKAKPTRTTLTVADVVALGATEEHARDWFIARKSVPLTQTALERVQREATSAGITFAEAVRYAAEHSWRGFEAAWLARLRPDQRHAPQPSAKAWRESRQGVIERARSLGMDAWDEIAAHLRTGPDWRTYRKSVIEADTKRSYAA